MKKISLVIPCYNEEQNVRAFFQTCKEILCNTLYDIEFIFINDGSRDNTEEKLDCLLQDNASENIMVINFSRNFGKEAAILAGLDVARGEYVSIIDADLQQHPKYVLEMVEFLDLNQDFDCVACYQEKRKEGSVLSFFKKLFYKTINVISEIDFTANASDFRTLKREMVNTITSMREYQRFSKGIFSWVGYKTHFMPYEVEDRHAGETSWSFKSLCRYAVSGIIGYSTKPLRMATYLGVVLSLVSFLYLFMVVLNKLLNQVEIPGYTTIVSIILLMGGFNMLLIGILGEYIAQIFIQVKNRPIYIIKSKRTTFNSRED